ncbi:MAG: hypothetical protein IJW15_04895 [Clostridia bacterium]|nr:hypothetical protein [Clostridia bacterium]
MIDIHSHILPEMDDGSKSVDESIKMLSSFAEQDVNTVVATPHFYIGETSVEEFLEKRDRCKEKLMVGIGDMKRPRISFGAEVQFFPELYSMDRAEELCISGTGYMLVEMPFEEWNRYTYMTLAKLYTAKGITPIIAHVERYLDFQKESDIEVVKKLKDVNALIQMNTSFLTYKPSRRRALNLIKKGLINFLGSDTHNTETRPPQLRPGFDIIYQKLGDDGIDAFAYWGEKIMEKIILV